LADNVGGDEVFPDFADGQVVDNGSGGDFPAADA